MKTGNRKPKINENENDNSKPNGKKVKRKKRYMTIPPVPKPKDELTPLPPLQKLYVSCLDVFKGVNTVPSPSGTHSLLQILDRMVPKDVGLRDSMTFVSNDTTVMYSVICHAENFLIYLLFLPENAIIPLHDHPGMTVFSKLLVGQMRIKALDMVKDPYVINEYPPPSPKSKLACLKEEGVLIAPCKTKVLFPTSGGNIHEFKAIKPCAILDVAGPPFSKEEGRDCSYFKDVAAAVSANAEKLKREVGKRYRWLEGAQLPERLTRMDRRDYLGPEIVEK